MASLLLIAKGQEVLRRCGEGRSWSLRGTSGAAPKAKLLIKGHVGVLVCVSLLHFIKAWFKMADVTGGQVLDGSQRLERDWCCVRFEVLFVVLRGQRRPKSFNHVNLSSLVAILRLKHHGAALAWRRAQPDTRCKILLIKHDVLFVRVRTLATSCMASMLRWNLKVLVVQGVRPASR